MGGVRLWAGHYFNAKVRADRPSVLPQRLSWALGAGRDVPRSALALVLILVTAGCLGAKAPEPAATNGAAPAAATGPQNDDGSRPTQVVDTGAMPHMHDYWKSRERVTLYEGDVDPGQIDLGDQFVTTGAHKEAKTGSITWHLPDGSIVYEGAGQMDLTATWNDPKITSLSMAFKAASDKQMRSALPLESAKAVTLPLTPDMTDMPHTKASRWEFHFAPAQSPGALMAPFHLKVDIVKLGDINTFPAHPRLFGGKHEKVINDASYEFSESSYVMRAPQLFQTGEFGEKLVTPTDIVPMESAWIRAELDISKATSTPGQVVDVNFFYRGANTSYLGHPYWLPSAGNFASKHMQWDFPVMMEQTDSPYAKESQWRFFVEPATSITGQDPKGGGTTDVTISYHLKLTVFDHQPDGATASKSESGRNG